VHRALLGLCVACSFNKTLETVGDADTAVDARIDAAIDAPPDAPPMEGIDFLPPGEETFSTTNWSVSADTAIDTTAMTIAPLRPAGATFLVGTQDNGAAIAILRVGDFTIGAGRIVTVTGDKPLAIVSDHDVTIAGRLDVGAKAAARGPGGALPAMGAGAGGMGLHEGGGGFDDSGSGGGSFGTAGSAGGRAGTTVGGAAGATYTLTGLIGGSGGGLANVCSNSPGAGGGALLLYAKHKLDVTGAITAGGGGGAGGLFTGCTVATNGGAGGGSGGTIWLQTPDLKGNGILAANGGGGGGAAVYMVGPGAPGQDGQASTTMVATGGMKANGTEGSSGGNGAIQGIPASMVPDIATGNGGGGGGGLGRIVYRAPNLGMLQSSPTAVVP
jgi:hypothetical protein